jgi:hypothetical protein
MDERVVLDLQVRQLQAALLEDSTEPTANLLLTLYLVLPSVAKATALATAQGLRVPGAKGSPRAVLDTDLYALIRGDACAVASQPSPVLLDMARKKFGLRGGWMPSR